MLFDGQMKDSSTEVKTEDETCSNVVVGDDGLLATLKDSGGDDDGIETLQKRKLNESKFYFYKIDEIQIWNKSRTQFVTTNQVATVGNDDETQYEPF